VFALDVIISTGEGKPKEVKTIIYLSLNTDARCIKGPSREVIILKPNMEELSFLRCLIDTLHWLSVSTHSKTKSQLNLV
jgi:hypothetical protein